MKPGRVKNEFGLIGSPIYSSFHVVEFELCKYVVSFNGATRLIQGHEVFTQAFCELSVISIVPNLFFTHSRLNHDSGGRRIRLPLGPHLRDYCGWGRLRA